MALTSPAIFVPGITASYLRDEYPLPPEIIWAVIRKNYERAALHPDNPSYEAREPARVVAGQLYEIAYEEIIDELRSNLTDRADRPVPVFPFSYDWRMPLEQIEAQLNNFVEEVIERTRLMRHYHPAYGQSPKVNLIGHSMGGLIIAGYLERHGNRHRIGKVVTLASPYQGSFEAVIKITTGTANLGTSPPSSREREAARLTPSLYHLIPSFDDGFEAPPGLPANLFEPGLWQPSIVETIANYVRSHGTAPGNRLAQTGQAQQIFSGFLKTAMSHRARIDQFDLSTAGLVPKDWLCIVGVDSVTRIRLKVVLRNGKPDFAFQREDRRNRWNDDNASSEEQRQTGDGTVPFEGAVPRFLPYNSLLCVTPSDYGYWEIGDSAATRLGGFHGILPNMNLLHRLIVRHFTGQPDRHRNTWAWPPPGVGHRDWDPPLTNLKKH